MASGAEELTIRGRCHCGNIAFELAWPRGARVTARACGCSFCTRHGGTWTSDPAARLIVHIDEPASVSHYSFGTRTAVFHVCARCGVVPLVTSSIADRLYAVVNVNAFDDLTGIELSRAATSFDGETLQSRLERRQRHWIADVRIIDKSQAR